MRPALLTPAQLLYEIQEADGMDPFANPPRHQLLITRLDHELPVAN